MKVWKKLTALALCAACVCALICVPPAKAAAAVSTFPDITDAQVGRAVEALRTMGVIDGSGGLYLPGDSLTRAQFCKMALLVMGKGSEADAQASRTIFSDVPGSHWARGYVNLAATTTVGGEADKGGSRLMMGLGNGTFAPDRPITYGEAVTAILRILEYVKEASANWPYGAVSTASALGLDSGFTPPAAGDPIDRAQAALLFCNMLTTPMEGDKGIFADSLGTVQENWLLVSLDAKTASGREGAVQFVDKTGKKAPVLPAVHTPSASFLGTQGTAVIKDDQLLTFIPHMNADSRTLTVADATSGSTCTITGSDGNKLSFTRSTVVLDGETPTNYGAIFSKLNAGTTVVACFDTSGAVDYLYIESFSPVDSLKSGVMVARDKVSGNPFAQLTAGTTDYKIVKNGAEVTTSALKQYDVAAFEPTSKTLYVTDFRLTGVYESATPNTTMPTKIKVLGKELDVLDSALDDLKDLKLNSTITLLLSPDGKVAGAVSSSTLRSNTVGWVDPSSTAKEIKINLLNSPTSTLSSVSGPFSSDFELSDAEAERLIPSYINEPFDQYFAEHIDEMKKKEVENLCAEEVKNQTAKIRITYEGSPLTIEEYLKKRIDKELEALQNDHDALMRYDEAERRKFFMSEPVIGTKSINEQIKEITEAVNTNMKAGFEEEVQKDFAANESKYRNSMKADLCKKIREDERAKHSAEILARLSNYRSSLVTVTGSTGGLLSLSRLSGKAVSDALNPKARTLGSTPLADNIAVFEKVGTSDIKRVSLANIAAESVPASKIVYQRTDSAGKIDLLILDDVTGDLYTYGIATVGQEKTGTGFDDEPIYNTVTTVKNSKGETVQTIGGTTYNDKQFIGLVASSTHFSDTQFYRPAASVALKSVTKVTPANFNLSTGIFFSGSIELPIWDEVQCYNAKTKTWFDVSEKDKPASPMDNLNACLAYSNDLTVYYDRDPAQGGKVRIVVAN